MLKFDFDGLVLLGFTVKWYGILIAAGILLGVLLATRREKRLGLPRETALDVALVGVPCAIVGARLYYVAFTWEKYSGNLLSILNLRQGGLAIYGGILGGLVGGLIYARIKKLPFASLLDLAAPSFALGQAIGRWGNFFNREAYGDAISDAALRFFPVGVLIPADGLWHYATFFYESAWCFIIVALLLYAERRGFFRARGDVFLWYALLYALERALVEGLRTDSLYLGSIRVSQLLSLLAALAAVSVIALRVRSVRPALLALIPAIALVACVCLGVGWPSVLPAAASAAGACLCYSRLPARGTNP